MSMYKSIYDEYFKIAEISFRNKGIDYINWKRLKAQGIAESNLDEKVVSKAGAIGIMQVMPATGKEIGYAEHELYIAERNIFAGATYLLKMWNKWDMVDIKAERWKIALASYNAGIGNIRKAAKIALKNGFELYWASIAKFLEDVTGKYCKETINYVYRVQKIYEDIKEVKDE